MLVLGKKRGGGNAELPLNDDGSAVVVDSKTTKLLEANAAATSLLSALEWTGGDIVSPAFIFCKANGANMASVFIGAVGGTKGIEIPPGESVEISDLNVALTQIRITLGDEADLTAQVPA